MKYLLLMGILLMLPLSANAESKHTSITLQVSENIVKNMQEVTFSGVLTDSEGKGIRDKSVTIYRDGPLGPEPLTRAFTGIDGEFSVVWRATLDINRDLPSTVFAQFDGDEKYMPSRSARVNIKIELVPLNIVITTDKNKNNYFVGDRAFISVAVFDNNANFVDADVLKATFDEKIITLERVDTGRYTFETPRLVKFDTQFSVSVLKFGYRSVQDTLTITVFGTNTIEPIRVTAGKSGDEINIMISNDELSSKPILAIEGMLVGAVPLESDTEGWLFEKISVNSFTFKSLESSIEPGESVTLRLKVRGDAEKLLWTAIGLYEKHIDTGMTVVKALPL